jgi:hypothetical protein
MSMLETIIFQLNSKLWKLPLPCPQFLGFFLLFLTRAPAAQ